MLALPVFIAPSCAKDWLAEMRQLGSEGRYFFSLNRYLVVADKAAA